MKNSGIRFSIVCKENIKPPRLPKPGRFFREEIILLAIA